MLGKWDRRDSYLDDAGFGDELDGSRTLSFCEEGDVGGGGGGAAGGVEVGGVGVRG